MPSKSRETWSSRAGFVLAASGAAIGLGNIQRFPYITAQCGGGAFLMLYLLCVLLLGVPLILVEFSIGRRTQRGPAFAFHSIKKSRIWGFLGFLSVLTAFSILCYYIVPAGWALGFSVLALGTRSVTLSEFTHNAFYSIGSTAALLTVSMMTVRLGLRGGVEKLSKYIMPCLFAILVILVINSLTLPGSMDGVIYYLSPDFSKIDGKVVLLALSQAFFSLCIGEAVLITYGSYAPAEEKLITTASLIALFDTLVAVLSGLIVFPALSAFKIEPQEDLGLIYEIMPKVFAAMPMGGVFNFLFFLLLAFAALTTSIALLEICVSFLTELTKISRKKASFSVSLSVFLISIPIALSKGAHPYWSSFQYEWLGKSFGLLEALDFVWGNIAMVCNGLVLCLFAGWIWGSKEFLKQIHPATRLSKSLSAWTSFYLRFVAPIFIVSILLGLLLW